MKEIRLTREEINMLQGMIEGAIVHIKLSGINITSEQSQMIDNIKAFVRQQFYYLIKTH